MVTAKDEVGGLKDLALYGGIPCIPNGVMPEFHWPYYTSQDEEFIIQALKNRELSYNQSSHLITQLEQEFRDYIGAEFCIAMNSGTSALSIAFWALGLQPGDEVLVPTYTFPATVMPLLQLGVKIVFVDCNKLSPVLSIDDFTKKISENTKAVIVSHMDGMANGIQNINEICSRLNVPIIEDCAQALGTKVCGKHAGTWGTFGIFSFQQKKIVSAGEGGMLITNNRTLYEKCILACYLQKRSNEEVSNPGLRQFAYTGLGQNYRMHPIVAAIAISQLKHLDQNIAERRKTFGSLVERLSKYECLFFPQARVSEEICSLYSFRMIYNPKHIYEVPLELFLNALYAEGLAVIRSTTEPLHLQPIFNYDNACSFFAIYKSQKSDVFVKENLLNSMEYSQSAFRLAPYSNLSIDALDAIEKAFEKVIKTLSNSFEYKDE